MLDTMTMTKAGGAVCGALLVFLLGGWAAESLYHTGGGHGDDVAQGYSIAVETDQAAVEVVVEDEVPFEELFASADPAAGERLWRQCSACHKLEQGANGTGPYLYNVVGRDKGTAEGFNYSETLATMEGDWTPENLSGFLTNPREYAPGTKMVFRGLSEAEDRANLIAYLATFN
jgi:cytochrome c